MRDMYNQLRFFLSSESLSHQPSKPEDRDRQ